LYSTTPHYKLVMLKHILYLEEVGNHNLLVSLSSRLKSGFVNELKLCILNTLNKVRYQNTTLLS